MLQRFNELLPAIVIFFDKKGRHFPELTDPIWLQDFAFLVDITAMLNELNIKLQGKDKDLSASISEVSAFGQKLQFWKGNLAAHDTTHFPCLQEHLHKQDLSQAYNSEDHIQILVKLEEEFQTRFADFKKIEQLAQFITSPFSPVNVREFSSCVRKHFPAVNIAAIEMEVIELQYDLV